jgi:hypothetical protein
MVEEKDIFINNDSVLNIDNKLYINDLFDKLLLDVNNKIEHNLLLHSRFMFINGVITFTIFAASFISTFIIIKSSLQTNIYPSDKELLIVLSLLFVIFLSILINVCLGINKKIIYYCCMGNMYNQISIEIFDMTKGLSDDIYLYQYNILTSRIENLINYKIIKKTE